ncbi:putative serine/threonine protein kinase [Actinacidiphila reveromycinica]|uniref:non-specific serine/threonine protein kinase n=1 Tax=Actinacidiphila reveromycinica TaxID=659352 RepID=A0A7U3UVW6_9ACTN|nr:serine/threonine-protein kinase [Streptomyces sp. SN-593]BBA99606.1 putative serine/threonine protein kinase [Streptomyces sp. SN-593]
MSEDEGTDGRVLADRYRLGGVLGKGGMGTVWRAVDETLGRNVAVKELRFPGNVDEDEKRRLVTRTLREAKATARIRSTGAITVFDVVKEDDRPWIVMELVEGRSLADAIREDGPLSPRRAAEIGLVLLDVLRAAHAEGILHRDVKPSNVLLAEAGDDEAGRASGAGRVVLGDFGIALIDGDPSVTSTGMLVGAPSYISPERARGQKPGPPADLWSLGALLYASVEGHPPYDKGSAIATLTAVMTEPVGPMRNAGPLAEVITGLLVKDPQRRLDDAGARRLLDAVVNAPEEPAAPAADATRMMALPAAPPAAGAAADPQPVPTDAPPAARKAALDQARAREALRSLRKAADRKAPAGPGAAAPAGPARAPLSDVVPRRTLVIVIAVVLVALLGTLIGVAVANSGGGDDKGGKGAPSGTPSTSISATGRNAAETTGQAQDPDGATGGPATTASTKAPSSASPSTSSSGTGTLPAGWHVFKDSEGFSIALPAGWKRVGDDGYGVGSRFKGSGGENLLVDWTHHPGKSALGNWRTSAAAAPGSMPGYHQIKVVSADYRDYDAADWEYTRQEQGKAVHVLNRGMVTDAKHGYALMFTTPAGAWGDDANAKRLATFFSTFKPAE